MMRTLSMVGHRKGGARCDRQKGSGSAPKESPFCRDDCNTIVTKMSYAAAPPVATVRRYFRSATARAGSMRPS